MTTTYVAYEPLQTFLGGSDGMQAEHLGVNVRTIQRWKRQGLPRDRAESCADRFGLHPWELWPELRDHDLDAVHRSCAAPDCAETFLVKWRGAKRRFCCTTCQKRTHARLRYATDSRARERRLRKNRAYRREVREAQARRRTA